MEYMREMHNQPNINRQEPKLGPPSPAPRTEPAAPPRPLMNAERSAHIAEQKAAKTAQVAAHEKGRQELTRRAETMLTLLVERWPRCFNLDQPRPLKIGIDRDIITAMPGTVEMLAGEADLRLAMKIYTGCPAYLMAMVEGAQRVDLDGQPAGTVLQPHAGYAKFWLKKDRSKVRPPQGDGALA